MRIIKYGDKLYFIKSDKVILIETKWRYFWLIDAFITLGEGEAIKASMVIGPNARIYWELQRYKKKAFLAIWPGKKIFVAANLLRVIFGVSF